MALLAAAADPRAKLKHAPPPSKPMNLISIGGLFLEEQFWRDESGVRLGGCAARGGGEDEAVVGKCEGEGWVQPPGGSGERGNVAGGEPQEEAAGGEEGAGTEGEEGGGAREGARGDGVEERGGGIRKKYQVRIDLIGRTGGGLGEGEWVVLDAAAENFDVSQI